MFASKDTLFTIPSGYNISRSVRLRSSASAYFSRTPASTTNRRTFTWSGWMKRGQDKYSLLFAAGNTTDIWNTGTNCTLIGYWISTNQLAVYNNGTVWRNTSQVFRDPSAWYHIVVAVDTTNATAANRVRVYINGSEVTAWDTNNAPALNTDTAINVNQNHFVAGQSTNVANAYFDGYLTEINFIDGQALTPSSFGSTNAITGVWQPAKYTGTYGTNGFYLNFSDNSNNTATTIGKDYSGNGNNWTPNNISVTSGSTYDSMTDVPTLTSATAANFCVLNPLDRNSTYGSVSDGNLTQSVSTANHAVVFGSMAMPTGKTYLEVTSGTTTSATPLLIAFGLATQSASRTGYGNSNTWSIKCIDVRTLWNGASSSSNFGGVFTSGTSLQLAYDSSTGYMWIGDGTNWYNSTGGTTGNPASGTNPSFTISTTEALFFFMDCYAGSGTVTAYANFGQRPFTYTPPSGFVALNTYNLPASTISNGATVMAATTYTGTGATASISNAVNGVSMKPDFVWLKSRSNVTNHYLMDSVRGASQDLYSNSTAAEGASGNVLTAFNSNGFSLGTDAEINGSTRTYVAWQWQAGQGSTSSNTSGSITSTVSVNATAGFSVVTYTGTGANATVGHGLGVAPQMVIVKSRSLATGWNVYHQYANASPASGVMTLQTTDAFFANSAWNSTTPTSSVFSIGPTGYGVNNSGATYVAYCWAAVKGFSAFGSYTGNGSADGPFVYTGFRPRWILFKDATNAATNWVLQDTSRFTYNLVTGALLANTSASEYSTGYDVDILSNGFKLRRSGGDTNASSATIIYAAFAENPFKNALAR